MELRDAVQEDLMLLYTWANDPEVRKNSFSTDQITLEEHIQWFHNVLSREDIKQYILVDEGKDIGQVRLRIDQENAEVSYSISSEYRHKGYGKAVIALLKEKVKKELPDIKRITAQVKPQNTASKRVFSDAGFLEKSLIYEWMIQ